MPYTIHQLLPTLSPALLPFLSLSAASWKRQHPQWEYRQWTLQEVRELMWHEYPTLTRTASDGMLAIAARYLILCREGGLYADADVECARPFDDLTAENRLCLAESPDTCGDGRLTDTLMLAGQQEHPFLRFVLDRMEQEPELLEKPGNTLLTLLYEEFEDKETVTLLPASAVMPCTEDEMELYRRGKLAEDEMRQRTEGARSLCYYRLDRRPSARPVRSEKTEIAYVSTTAGGVGGAFQAGLRIHLGLRSIGLHSTMLVLQSGLSAEENRRHDIRPVRRMTGQPCGYGAAMRPLKAYPNYDMGSHGFDPAETGVNLVEDIEALNPRLVILHGVNGGLASIETLPAGGQGDGGHPQRTGPLALPSRRPPAGTAGVTSATGQENHTFRRHQRLRPAQGVRLFGGSLAAALRQAQGRILPGRVRHGRARPGSGHPRTLPGLPARPLPAPPGLCGRRCHGGTLAGGSFRTDRQRGHGLRNPRGVLSGDRTGKHRAPPAFRLSGTLQGLRRPGPRHRMGTGR